jgi:lysyl endopeptidase
MPSIIKTQVMDKKISGRFAFVFIMLMMGLKSFSQLSAGGTPPGFKFAPSNLLPIVYMPAINVDSMLAEDAINDLSGSKPYRFGYNHLVYFKPDNSGTWTEVGNGDHIWQLDIKTRGGYSINLAFSNFQLPAGAKLFVYSKDHKQVLGGFTEKNTSADKFFGTELITGDEVVVEYYEPASARGTGDFILFRITQGYKDLKSDLKSFGQAGSCIHNINCPQYIDYRVQKRSVICLVANGGEICSGALVNNTLNDGTPYILTANHCGPADGAWVFRFNWEAPGCPNPATESSTAQSISGCTLIAQSGVSDFLLVKMDSVPPPSFHAFYAGWNHGLTPATSVTGIHHPSGDIKKCTRADNAVTDTFYDAGNGVALTWQIGQWTDGVTEPGSSGSPLFDQNKRIVGQLYGGPSQCGATPDLLRDYYGRFNVSWDSGATPQTRLKDWLDPVNSGAVTNDGYDPNRPVDTLDIAALGVTAPVGASCSSVISPAISVINLGSITVTSIKVNYHVDNGTVSSYTWTGTLDSMATTTINLPVMSVSPGFHTLYVNVNLPAGLTDQNVLNDSASGNFSVYDSVSQAAPLVQGFEASFPPAGWVVTVPPSGATWALCSNGAFGTSGHAVVVDEFAPASSTAGETPQMITTPVDMTYAPSPSYLKFDVAYAPYPAQYDSLAVSVSTDCGVSWTLIYQKGGDSLSTALATTTDFVPTNSQWRKDSVNISNLSGQTDVLFRFEDLSGYGNALYIDNIDIADSGGPIGIAQINDVMQVRVFPNPFNQHVNLQFGLDAVQNITAAVYSVDGKKVINVLENEKTDAGQHQLEINTDRLSNGIYILKVNEHAFKLEKLK